MFPQLHSVRWNAMQLPSRRKERRRKGRKEEGKERERRRRDPPHSAKPRFYNQKPGLLLWPPQVKRPLSDNAPFYNQKPGLSPPKPSTKGKEKNAEEGTLPTLQNRDSTTRNLAYDVPYLLQSPRQCAVLQPETWLMIYSIKGP